MNLDNIRYSVWNFPRIRYLSDSVQNSVRDSVRVSVQDPVGRSARALCSVFSKETV